ncbi:MAG: hypothetical protein GYA55_07600, partial [SAR324 cluster bacterium]|nr:hypothetical protein [SAR324 cluster bacterium]
MSMSPEKVLFLNRFAFVLLLSFLSIDAFKDVYADDLLTGAEWKTMNMACPRFQGTDKEGSCYMDGGCCNEFGFETNFLDPALLPGGVATESFCDSYCRSMNARFRNTFSRPEGGASTGCSCGTTRYLACPKGYSCAKCDPNDLNSDLSICRAAGIEDQQRCAEYCRDNNLFEKKDDNGRCQGLPPKEWMDKILSENDSWPQKIASFDAGIYMCPLLNNYNGIVCIKASTQAALACQNSCQDKCLPEQNCGKGKTASEWRAGSCAEETDTACKGHCHEYPCGCPECGNVVMRHYCCAPGTTTTTTTTTIVVTTSIYSTTTTIEPPTVTATSTATATASRTVTPTKTATASRTVT